MQVYFDERSNQLVIEEGTIRIQHPENLRQMIRDLQRYLPTLELLEQLNIARDLLQQVLYLTREVDATPLPHLNSNPDEQLVRSIRSFLDLTEQFETWSKEELES